MVFSGAGLFAQEAEERLTQEQFAVELVKAIKLDGSLPVAPLAGDCVKLLESIGISPFGGWKNKEFLKQEDYLVILAKVHGKEGLVFEKAAEVEERNIKVINQKWQDSYGKTGQWTTLSELLNDKAYFPEGAPVSPYKLKYEDKNGDHQVDPHFYPAAFFVK